MYVREREKEEEDEERKEQEIKEKSKDRKKDNRPQTEKAKQARQTDADNITYPRPKCEMTIAANRLFYW